MKLSIVMENEWKKELKGMLLRQIAKQQKDTNNKCSDPSCLFSPEYVLKFAACIV